MTSGAKMRVYEIAKELKVPNKELIAKIRALGLEVNNHMSSLDAEDVNRLKRSIERERLEQTETKRLSSTVLRRRSKGDGEPGSERGPETEPPAPPERPAERSAVRARPPAGAPEAAPSGQRRSQPPVATRRPEQPTVAARPAPQPPQAPVQPRVQVRERFEARPPESAPQRPAAPAQPRPQSAPSAPRPEQAQVAAPPPAPSPVAPIAERPRPPVLEATEVVPPAPTQARPPAEPAPRQETTAEAAKDSVKEPAKSVTKEAIQETTTDAAAASRREAQVEVRSEVAKQQEMSAPKPEVSVQKAAPPAAAKEPEPEAARLVKPASSAGPAITEKQPERPAAEAARVTPGAAVETAPPRPAPAPQVQASSAEAEREAPRKPAAPARAERAESIPQPESRKPRAPVVVAGPPVVTIGQGPAPAKNERDDGKVQPRMQQQQQDKRRPPGKFDGVVKRPGKKGPTTVQEVAQAARSRFEEELARARERVTQREAEEKKARENEEARLEQRRDPARPQPGQIIALPIPRIKILEQKPTQPRQGQVPGQGQIRGRFATQQQKGRNGNARNKARDFGKKRPPLKKGRSTQITTPAEHKRIIRMEEMISIPDIARAMGVKANEVLKKLWGMGMVGLNINASIDFETSQILASEFGYEVQNVAFKEAEAFVSQPDEEKDLSLRAPVVTVMGHVDHGKTSLLDYIRKSRVAAGEAGGITQHVAAYKVPSHHGDIVFLDTPGHEAFTEMRARGAQATDIVVLVVAANDGVMPQTVEALNHAKDAKVTIIVAVNKCDLPDAQPERVRQQLAEHGLIPEEWGGETQYVNVSAMRGDGIAGLLDSIALQAELLELRANPNKPAMGVIIEAKLDRNRGPMATVLVQEGQLRVGDTVVAGCYYGKVRAMLDDLGKPTKVAGPSTPVELLGLDGVPEAGETLNVADDEKVAKQVVEHRRQQRRKKELANSGRISLENLMERIQEGGTHELKVVLKTDVQGSSEALKAALVKLSTDKVRVNVIQAGVGGITESDVNLAKAGAAVIVGFHVRPAGKSAKHAEKEGVEIKLYDVIYDALEDVRSAMVGLLAPIKREHEIGKLEVRDTFNIPKMGTVAGCMVTEGRVLRKSLLRVIRDSVQVYEGKVGSLRRFKDDASEVKEGYECGLMVQGFNDIRVGDIVEAYEIIEEAAKL